jgi:cyclopropane fatty-acyl-phospholipid synthase-like methyltransferase
METPITVQDDWYKDFFAGLNCEMWVKAASVEWTNQEVDFLVDVLNTQPGTIILDIPCGFGRHTIEMAKRGYAMTGVDISTDFIQRLRQQLEDEQLPIEAIQGDVLTTYFEPRFDGAYCLGNSFGYVNYEGMNMFVGNVSAALKSGARFVINSGLIAESILPNFPKTGHYVLGDLIMDISNSYIIGDSCMITELTYTQGDHTEKHLFKHYVYTLADIKRLLASHGLQTIAVYNSTEKLPYQLGDKQIYLVAEKV